MSDKARPNAASPQLYRFEDDGKTPNNPRLPLILYRDVLRVPAGRDPATVCEDIFAGHGWANGWRNGIFPSCTSTPAPMKCWASPAGRLASNSAATRARCSTSRPVTSSCCPPALAIAASPRAPIFWSSAPIRRAAVRSIRPGRTRSIFARHAGTSPMSASPPRTRCTARMGHSPNSGPIAEGARGCMVTTAAATRRGSGALRPRTPSWRRRRPLQCLSPPPGTWPPT